MHMHKVCDPNRREEGEGVSGALLSWIPQDLAVTKPQVSVDSYEIPPGWIVYNGGYSLTTLELITNCNRPLLKTVQALIVGSIWGFSQRNGASLEPIDFLKVGTGMQNI